jgi:hypothetical protein
MKRVREIRTCSRCRSLKLRCDQSKPSCQRCARANATCSLGACTDTIESGIDSSNSVIEIPHQSGTKSSDSSITGREPQLHFDNQRNEITAHDAGLIKQRQKAQLSCIRCHRLKVKCDRDLPCSRCRVSGWGKFCEYRYRIERANPPLDKSTANTLGQDPEGRVRSWLAQRRGGTHWDDLISSVSTLFSKLVV